MDPVSTWRQAVPTKRGVRRTSDRHGTVFDSVSCRRTLSLLVLSGRLLIDYVGEQANLPALINDNLQSSFVPPALFDREPDPSSELPSRQKPFLALHWIEKRC